jgi:hypothetical protein
LEIYEAIIKQARSRQEAGSKGDRVARRTAGSKSGNKPVR